jgi:hypothetical protein
MVYKHELTTIAELKEAADHHPAAAWDTGPATGAATGLDVLNSKLRKSIKMYGHNCPESLSIRMDKHILIQTDSLEDPQVLEKHFIESYYMLVKELGDKHPRVIELNKTFNTPARDAFVRHRDACIVEENKRNNYIGGTIGFLAGTMFALLPVL